MFIALAPELAIQGFDLHMWILHCRHKTLDPLPVSFLGRPLIKNVSYDVESKLPPLSPNSKRSKR